MTNQYQKQRSKMFIYGVMLDILFLQMNIKKKFKKKENQKSY